MDDKEKRSKRIIQKERNYSKWVKRETKEARRNDKWRDTPTTFSEITKRARRMSNHGKLCSCVFCGNPRRHFKELTIQEKKIKDELYFRE